MFGWVGVTILPDGSQVVATSTPDQEEFAHKLGYSSADVMNAEHDPLHLKLCLALGLPTSPTLDRVAQGDGRCSDRLRDLEEAMVLATQQFLNVARCECWVQQ